MRGHDIFVTLLLVVSDPTRSSGLTCSRPSMFQRVIGPIPYLPRPSFIWMQLQCCRDDWRCCACTCIGGRWGFYRSSLDSIVKAFVLPRVPTRCPASKEDAGPVTVWISRLTKRWPKALTSPGTKIVVRNSRDAASWKRWICETD